MYPENCKVIIWSNSRVFLFRIGYRSWRPCKGNTPDPSNTPVEMISIMQKKCARLLIPDMRSVDRCQRDCQLHISRNVLRRAEITSEQRARLQPLPERWDMPTAGIRQLLSTNVGTEWVWQSNHVHHEQGKKKFHGDFGNKLIINLITSIRFLRNQHHTQCTF